MNENKKVPKLRFPEFSGDWEEKKLGEVACYRNGKAHEQLICSDGKYIVVNSKFISTNGKTKKFSNTQIEPLYKDEITFVLSDIPNGKAIAKTFLIETDQKYTLNQRIAGINTLENNYPYYMYVLMNRNKYFLKFDDGVNQTNISKKDVENWKEYYPTFEEQQKIGNFFKKLDESISLQKNKIDNLKLQKKALLQKMFPKNGETVPEIRFPEFSGDWEEKKLGEIVERITRKNIDLKSDLPLTISAEHGLVDQITFFNKKIASKDISGYYLLNNGEFAYNKSYSKNYPWGVVKRLEKYDSGVLSTLYILFKPVKINSDFLVVYYETNSWHKEVAVRASEGARNHGLLNITAKDFLETKLLVPETKLEQQKIGNFFKKLDTLILLNQQKLENLEKRKKGLLQKMFV